MERSARAARRWTWAWASTNAAATVAQIAVATVVPKGRRTELWIGAAGSGVGAAAVVLVPLRVIRDRRALEKRIRNRRPGSDPCPVLAEAERFLIRDARSEGFGTGPVAHAGNVLLNLGIGIATAVTTHRHREAALTGVAGIVVGEIQINTQPRRSVRLLERYRTGHLQPTGAGVSLRPGLALGRNQIGASVELSF
jgi:hypothetical protein